ncbi:acetyl-CoA carboxylase, carboxyltransferase subunit beta [Natronincola ferrireducens]|uniref:Acetyl-coenzyme A carboxylase carboxyl transferase subunit beta n=1 Tax=Natronincola ferrireducens TaxID=393762 RepID=A0A1G9A7W2_9FIRM|nr:acetyl-CoA carboxylase, carboxyltransferase subunit beta [Natronincola ferrireducens]SDK23397.1 acetyl-CoA carboxylase carboxyl transferase subunit beta [Natronincola ferrireducens]
MLKDVFGKKNYVTVSLTDNKEKITSLRENIKPTKNSYLQTEKIERISARDRINELIDPSTFIEYDVRLTAANPLNFPGYTDKVTEVIKKSNENEAVITGEGKIHGESCIVCVMDPSFMMGSMGSVVGEKITRAIEKAIEKRFPLIIFTASGGARMQEGILSLMQMAKVSAAIAKLSEEGLLYISVLTDPTTGGVTASFAMLGDIIIAEPGALIGFAGPRVIEQTIKQKLPEGFQRSEFLQEKGFVDKIVSRKDMGDVLSKILRIHTIGGELYE